MYVISTECAEMEDDLDETEVRFEETETQQNSLKMPKNEEETDFSASAIGRSQNQPDVRQIARQNARPLLKPSVSIESHVSEGEVEEEEKEMGKNGSVQRQVQLIRVYIPTNG